MSVPLTEATTVSAAGLACALEKAAALIAMAAAKIEFRRFITVLPL